LVAGLGLTFFWLVPALAGGGAGWGTFTDNPTTNAPGGTAGEGVNVGETTAGQQEKLLDSVKRFVNYVLALLAFIALIMLLYGGFTMITAAGDEAGYKKWFTVLKNAALWLAFIAVSWLIVSLIFFVLNLINQ